MSMRLDQHRELRESEARGLLDVNGETSVNVQSLIDDQLADVRSQMQDASDRTDWLCSRFEDIVTFREWRVLSTRSMSLKDFLESDAMSTFSEEVKANKSPRQWRLLSLVRRNREMSPAEASLKASPCRPRGVRSPALHADAGAGLAAHANMLIAP